MQTAKIVTELEHKEMTDRCNKYTSLVMQYCKENKTNGIPANVYNAWDVSISNDERSLIEVYDFVHDIPDKYFCYISFDGDSGAFSCKPNHRKPHYWQKMYITTWTGDILGEGHFTSNLFQSNMGDSRITFTIKAINGKVYHGTFYYSAGDYGRMRLAKNQ